VSDTRDAAARLEELLARVEPVPDAADPPDPEHTRLEPPPVEPAGETGDGLPDAPLFALLRAVRAEIGIDRTDRIWIFPPRRLETGETAVVVVAAYPDTRDGRRRVFAAHYSAPAQAGEPRLVLQEVGTAPAERVGRVVEEVVERLKEEPTAAPRAARIDGDPRHWDDLLHQLARAHLEAVVRHPRQP
jgi:hypothetical protein